MASTSRSCKLPQLQQMKTNLLSGSASTSSSALQVALESLSEWCSLPPCSPFSPLSLTSGSILTWTSPLFMSTSWGSGLGWTESVKEAALASWDPASLSGLFSSFTRKSPYEGSGALALPARPLSWSELCTSPAVASALLLSPDFEASAWEGEGALSVSELLSPPEEETRVCRSKTASNHIQFPNPFIELMFYFYPSGSHSCQLPDVSWVVVTHSY